MKRISVIFVSFFFVSLLTFDISHVFSQQPTQEWVRRYSDTSTSLNFQGISVKTDSIGNIYVLTNSDNGLGYLKYDPAGNLLIIANHDLSGYIVASVAFTVTQSGDVYILGVAEQNLNEWMYTVKFNSNGTFAWEKLYNKDANDYAADIVQNRTGDIIVAGGAVIGNSSYALVIKYSPAGDTLWTRYFNNNQNRAYITKIAIDDINNIYAVGNITTIGKSLVMKITSNGSINWYNIFTLDSMQSNLGQGLTLDNTGNIYVLGTSSAFPYGLIGWILKLSNIGVVQWSRRFSGLYGGQPSCEYFAGPVISSDGNSVFYTINCANGTGGGGYSIVTLKYSSTGDSLWAKVYGGGGVPGTANIPAAIKLDRSNNVYVCGVGNFPVSGDDFLTLKYSSGGSQEWVATYPGTLNGGGDYANAIFIDSSLNVYVTGEDKNSFGKFVAVTIRYSQPIGIKLMSNTVPKDFKLKQNYPNPFNPSTKIMFEVASYEHVKIFVTDVLGRDVQVLTDNKLLPGTYLIEWQPSVISSGIYFYTIITETFRATKKAILIK